MNIKRRWRSFRNVYLTVAAIGVGVTGTVFLSQGWYNHVVRYHTASSNRHAANRERMWREATGKIPIPEHGDSVDVLAALMKPSMTTSLAKTTGLHVVNLPEDLAAAKIAANTVPDITSKLDWCIFGNTDNGYCATGGSFGNGFRTQIEDVLSGNLNAHLHQVRNATYTHWPPWSRSLQDLAILWFAISGIGYAASLMNDTEATWTRPTPGGYNEDVSTSFPNLYDADRATQGVLITSPLAVAITIGQNVHLWKMWSQHAESKQAAAKDEALLADHPKAESLLVAREVLAELEALDPKFKDDPDIAKAIKLAQGTVQNIEQIPELIELDKAKIEATMLVRKLLPVKDEVDSFTTKHQQLMAEYHYPDMQRALRGLPSAPEAATGDVLSDEELRKFLDSRDTQ